VPPSLSLEGLSRAFGAVRALDDVSLTVAAGSVVALVGASGSGKTSLLRCINRTLEPDRGTVRLDGVDVRTVVPTALRRRIGYVPQRGGLLPHWTVLRNVALVPQLVGLADPLAAAREAMARCGLPPADFAGRLPHELSGGQRQRAAIARALAARQDVLLLDEAFGALDAIARETLLEAFADWRAAFGFTAVLVTHDLAEAARLADVVAVMQGGRIEQAAPMAVVRDAPATPYVAQLIGRAQATARRLVPP
jgi:osmoprotectant transport system ATP-binding protein